MTDIDNTKQVLQKLKQLEQENIRLREQLQHQRRARYAADSLSLHCPQFLQALDMVAYAVDLKSRPVSYQGTVSKITGYDTADLLNGTIKWEELVYPEDLPLFLNKDRALINNTPHITEYRIISGKGQIRWVSDVSIMVNDEQDRPWLIEGLVSDITRFKETEEAFLERQAQLDSILNSVQDVIWSVTPDTFELIYINPAAEN
ncbi:MAG: PAS domain-containing protein, partial [Syntrophomonadaceae bacterium]